MWTNYGYETFLHVEMNMSRKSFSAYSPKSKNRNLLRASQSADREYQLRTHNWLNVRQIKQKLYLTNCIIQINGGSKTTYGGN